MTPESYEKKSLTRSEQIECQSQVLQLKKLTLSGEELFNLRRFFPLIDQFIKFQHYNYNQNSASKQEVHSPSLDLVPKRHLGIQMVLSNCDLPEKVPNLVKKKLCKEN